MEAVRAVGLTGNALKRTHQSFPGYRRGAQTSDPLMIKIIYLNWRSGRIQAELGRQIAAEKGGDVVVTYKLVCNTKYMAVYITQDRDISCKK